MTSREKYEQAGAAAREQWQKFNALVESGVTGAPLVMSNQKLARLEREAEDAWNAWRYPVCDCMEERDPITGEDRVLTHSGSCHLHPDQTGG